MLPYRPNTKRYQTPLEYRRCGKSGLLLPLLSLGLWHNFGHVDNFVNARKIIRTAFDHGITHFDLANNYGPPPGSAEEYFGKILKLDFKSFRDELIISTKAGWEMWPGPYGNLGSKKYLMASIDQSLRRMGLDYVDIFYHHRPDPDTPLEETLMALDLMVRQGKALYIGSSSNNVNQTRQAQKILKSLGTPCLVHQPRYNMFDRKVEEGLLDTLEKEGIGCIAFSPLNQGILTDKYLKGIPENSRAAKESWFLQKNEINKKILEKVNILNSVALDRGQSLAQMAISWILRNPVITSVLVGVRTADQLLNNLGAVNNLIFQEEEIAYIDCILNR